MTGLGHHHATTRILRFGSMLLIILAVAVAGCSEDDPTGPAVPADFDHALSTEADGLRLTVSTSQATYAFGETVETHVTLKNISDQTQVLDFARGNPARFSNINVSIHDGDDTQHHTNGEGTRDDFQLAPGETINATLSWNQNSRFGGDPVDRGFFRVSGRVDFDDRPAIRVDRLFIELD